MKIYGFLVEKACVCRSKLLLYIVGKGTRRGPKEGRGFGYDHGVHHRNQKSGHQCPILGISELMQWFKIFREIIQSENAVKGLEQLIKDRIGPRSVRVCSEIDGSVATIGSAS